MIDCLIGFRRRQHYQSMMIRGGGSYGSASGLIANDYDNYDDYDYGENRSISMLPQTQNYQFYSALNHRLENDYSNARLGANPYIHLEQKLYPQHQHQQQQQYQEHNHSFYGASKQNDSLLQQSDMIVDGVDRHSHHHHHLDANYYSNPYQDGINISQTINNYQMANKTVMPINENIESYPGTNVTNYYGTSNPLYSSNIGDIRNGQSQPPQQSQPDHSTLEPHLSSASSIHPSAMVSAQQSNQQIPINQQQITVAPSQPQPPSQPPPPPPLPPSKLNLSRTTGSSGRNPYSQTGPYGSDSTNPYIDYYRKLYYPYDPITGEYMKDVTPPGDTNNTNPLISDLIMNDSGRMIGGSGRNIPQSSLNPQYGDNHSYHHSHSHPQRYGHNQNHHYGSGFYYDPLESNENDSLLLCCDFLIPRPNIKCSLITLFILLILIILIAIIRFLVSSTGSDDQNAELAALLEQMCMLLLIGAFIVLLWIIGIYFTSRRTRDQISRLLSCQSNGPFSTTLVNDYCNGYLYANPNALPNHFYRSTKLPDYQRDYQRQSVTTMAGRLMRPTTSISAASKATRRLSRVFGSVLQPNQQRTATALSQNVHIANQQHRANYSYDLGGRNVPTNNFV